MSRILESIQKLQPVRSDALWEEIEILRRNGVPLADEPEMYTELRLALRQLEAEKRILLTAEGWVYRLPPKTPAANAGRLANVQKELF